MARLHLQLRYKGKESFVKNKHLGKKNARFNNFLTLTLRKNCETFNVKGMYNFDYKNFKRLNPFVKNKDIAEYLGVSEGYISKVISGQTQLTEERFVKLINHPTWNIDMFLQVKYQSDPTNMPPLPQGNTVQVGSITGNNNSVARGDITPDRSDNLPQWLPTTDNVESVAAEEVPFITKPVIESREVDIRQFIEEGKAKMIIPQGLIEQKVDYARKIYSDAMAPDIREGDIILCSFLPDTSYLVDGDIYALDTTKYGCVIRDIEHNGEEIILHARNHKHPNLIVKQTEILSVAVPMQLIRSTFSQRTDYEQIIKDKDDRIDLLVNREFDHIRHTDKLLEQIDRVTAQQGKLIEALVEKK